MTLLICSVLAFCILVPVVLDSSARRAENERQHAEQARREAEQKEAQRRANDPAEIARKQREQQAAAAQSAEIAKRGKRPVPSSWDGITPEVNAYLKANLRDYESLDLVECSDVVTWGDDSWAQRVKYRARNGFGGMNLVNQIFIIRGGQVVDVIGE